MEFFFIAVDTNSEHRLILVCADGQFIEHLRHFIDYTSYLASGAVR
jgi:hypothetical protein